MQQPLLKAHETADYTDAAVAAPALVSVVVPAYRCSASITQALESVFAQTVTNIEVIVVNDGCPDTKRLERVLQPYRHRIRYIKQGHRGPSAARNAGIIAATGKYIAFLDADDYWFSDHLAKQLEPLQGDSSLSLVYSNSLLLQGQEPVATAFGREPQMDSVSFEALVTGNCSISTSSVVASRKALLAAGLFNPRFMRCEDYDLWMRLAQTGHRMAFNRDVQVCHRLFNGLSSNVKSMRQARLDVYESLAADTKLGARRRQLVIRQIARTKALTEFAEAKRLLVSGEFGESLAAAQCANSELQSRTLSIFIFALRTVPALVRVLYRLYGLAVSTKKTIQVAILRSRYRRETQHRVVTGIAAVYPRSPELAGPLPQRPGDKPQSVKTSTAPMDWVELYTAAILERDEAKFTRNASKAQDAIRRHSETLDPSDPEREALEEALHNLEFLTRCTSAA